MTIDKHMFSAITTNNNYTTHIHQTFLHLPTAPSLLEKAAKVQSLTPTKAQRMPGWQAQQKPAEKVGFHEGKTGQLSQFVDSYQWIGIGYYSNRSAWVCPNIASPKNGLCLFKIETFHFIDDFHCEGYPEQTEKSIPTMLILSSYLLFYHFLVPHSSVPQNQLVRIPTVFGAPMGCMEKFEALQHLSQVEGYISKGVTICNLKHRK